MNRTLTQSDTEDEARRLAQVRKKRARRNTILYAALGAGALLVLAVVAIGIVVWWRWGKNTGVIEHVPSQRPASEGQIGTQIPLETPVGAHDSGSPDFSDIQPLLTGDATSSPSGSVEINPSSGGALARSCEDEVASVLRELYDRIQKVLAGQKIIHPKQ